MKKKKQRKAKKRNPNDATMRNINALKKRVKDLEEEMILLRQRYAYLKERWGK